MNKTTTLNKRNKFRSKFEATFAKDLEDRDIDYEYEKHKILFYYRKKGKCLKCGAKKVVVEHVYTPDFKIGRVYIETKGRLTSKDRTKMVAVRKSNPKLDIRFVFMYDNWCTKLKRERYSDWCKRRGFKYAFNTLPPEWAGDAIGLVK